MLTVERPSRFRENLKRSIARKFLAPESFVFGIKMGLFVENLFFARFPSQKETEAQLKAIKTCLKSKFLSWRASKFGL